MTSDLQARMKEHINQLLTENSLRFSWVPEADDCESWTEDDESHVAICRPIDRGNYLSALHQIGHHLNDRAQYQTRLDRQDLYVDEVHSWRWAFSNSIVNITPTAFRVVEDAINVLIKQTPIAEGFIAALETDAYKTNRNDRI